VRSKFEYGCQVWDPVLKKDIKIIEKVQNKALHFIFSIRSQVSYRNLQEATGIKSMKDRRKELR